MKKNNKKINKILKVISIISFLGAFIVLIITLYNNITLNNRVKEINVRER